MCGVDKEVGLSQTSSLGFFPFFPALVFYHCIHKAYIFIYPFPAYTSKHRRFIGLHK